MTFDQKDLRESFLIEWRMLQSLRHSDKKTIYQRLIKEIKVKKDDLILFEGYTNERLHEKGARPHYLNNDGKRDEEESSSESLKDYNHNKKLSRSLASIMEDNYINQENENPFSSLFK